MSDEMGTLSVDVEIEHPARPGGGCGLGPP
jgi:hypothetical protein